MEYIVVIFILLFSIGIGSIYPTFAIISVIVGFGFLFYRIYQTREVENLKSKKEIINQAEEQIKDAEKKEKEVSEKIIKLEEQYNSKSKELEEQYIFEKNEWQKKSKELKEQYNNKNVELEEQYLLKKDELEKGIEEYYFELENLEEEYNKKNKELNNQYKVKTDELENEYLVKKNELEKELEPLLERLNDVEDQLVVKDTQIFVDDNITSEEYKNKLSIIRLNQKEFIKNEQAVDILIYQERKKLKDNIKQILRCFNSETSAIINSLTVKNVDTSRAKIIRTFEIINNIFKIDGVQITKEYLEMKLEEFNLFYSYQQKKEEEKEEQKAIRQQMLEEEKVRREIEKEKSKIAKEEKQFQSEISRLMKYLQKSSDIEKQLYIDKIKELEEKLKLLERDKENVLQREQNTRAGYVYIISNIGSFGEDIYKIGMTRRLEPMDRIKELSSASVPFDFDVHAMIFSEDAPALENILHTTFRDKQINKVNSRKEFFKVSIDEIEKVVKENYNATVKFTKIAEAYQYRESLRLAKIS